MRPCPLNILYEDTDIIVCVKPHGLATQSKSFRTPDLEKMLLNHIARTAKSSSPSGKPYLAVIHRLDQPVAGILVFAKTSFAAKEFNKQLTSSGFGKHYYALVQGTPSSPSGTLEDYLVKDGRTNTSSVCTKGTKDAKLARLSYEIVERSAFNGFPDITSEDVSLLEVVLDTGRHHQIRVQLAHMGCPIVGDSKYNPSAAQPEASKNAQTLCLCAYKLSFTHPRTKKNMTFLYPQA